MLKIVSPAILVVLACAGHAQAHDGLSLEHCRTLQRSINEAINLSANIDPAKSLAGAKTAADFRHIELLHFMKLLSTKQNSILNLVLLSACGK